jgi:spore germination protein KA
MLNRWFFRYKKKQKKKEIVHEMGFQEGNQPLQEDLDHTLSRIKQELGNSPDLIIRTFQMGSESKNRVATVYMDGLTDKEKVNDFVARSLLIEPVESEAQPLIDPQRIFDVIFTKALTVGDVKAVSDWNGMMFAILSGDIVVLVNGCEGAIIGSIRGGEMRSITEPKTELTSEVPKIVLTNRSQPMFH